jgi:hypothetical protein
MIVSQGYDTTAVKRMQGKSVNNRRSNTLPFGEGGTPKGVTGEVLYSTSSVICSFLANTTFPKGEGFYERIETHSPVNKK